MNRTKNIISVCALKDIKTWFYASRAILRYCDSENYYVIVPAKDYETFRLLSPAPYKVINESDLTSNFSLSSVRDFLPDDRKNTAGWYYQQFLKIEALVSLPESPDDLSVIWDADTIPVKPLSFIDKNHKVTYFKSTENHQPYFPTINNLLGLEKIGDYSFIAQCFPIYQKWVQAFINDVERKHSKPWVDAILTSTDFSGKGGCFSEYETLGTYVFSKYPKEVTTTNEAWLRYGQSLYKSVDDFFTLENKKTNYAFISFEVWDTYTEDTNPYYLKNFDSGLISNLWNKFKNRASRLIS